MSLSLSYTITISINVHSRFLLLDPDFPIPYNQIWKYVILNFWIYYRLISINGLFLVSDDKGVGLGTVLEDIFFRTDLFDAIFAKKRRRSWQNWQKALTPIMNRSNKTVTNWLTIYSKWNHCTLAAIGRSLLKSTTIRPFLMCFLVTWWWRMTWAKTKRVSRQTWYTQA